MKNFLIFLLFISMACTKDNKPKNLLSKQKMTNLLYEVTLLNAMRSSILHTNDTVHKTILSKDLFKKYGIDSTQFVEQHRYYMQNTALYTEIFDSIQKRLEKNIKIAEQLPNENDSIQKIDAKIEDFKLNSTENILLNNLQ